MNDEGSEVCQGPPGERLCMLEASLLVRWDDTRGLQSKEHHPHTWWCYWLSCRKPPLRSPHRFSMWSEIIILSLPVNVLTDFLKLHKLPLNLWKCLSEIKRHFISMLTSWSCDSQLSETPVTRALSGPALWFLFSVPPVAVCTLTLTFRFSPRQCSCRHKHQINLYVSSLRFHHHVIQFQGRVRCEEPHLPMKLLIDYFRASKN